MLLPRVGKQLRAAVGLGRAVPARRGAFLRRAVLGLGWSRGPEIAYWKDWRSRRDSNPRPQD
jgi:hypothetical protein